MKNSDLPNDWFWNALDQSVTGTLTDVQEVEINRVLSERQNTGDIRKNADIRLTFGWYYLVVLWGKEKRNRKRLWQDRKKKPVVTFANAPVIIFFWVCVLISLYSLLALGLRGLVLLLT